MGTRSETSPEEGSDSILSNESTSECNRQFSGTSDKKDLTLTHTYDAQVRLYIDLIDNLRAYGLEKDVDLPAVAVIGDQSSGKSSTLEAISGIQLPRGAGIVTRCPLELRMKCNRNGRNFWRSTISYTDADGVTREKKITSPEQVAEAIRQAQKDITGSETGISENLITVEVEACNVPDLTLIDLPGIARVAVQNQSKDLPAKIKAVIQRYIRRQETIMLAVIPCNVDIATTEVLQLTQDCDPKGERTLGVLTKPDLVDRGAEFQVLQVINNKVFQLNKGYTVVKCRGQAALEANQSLDSAMEEEKKFFAGHDIFSIIPATKTGFPSLSRKLSSELVEHIKTVVPALKQDIKDKLEETRKTLELFREYSRGTAEDRQALLLDLVSRFTTSLKDLANGDYRVETNRKMHLLTLVRDKFDSFAEQVWKISPNEKDSILMTKIKLEIKANRGRELPRFMTYHVFEKLVQDLLKRVRVPEQICLQGVNTCLKRVLHELCDKTFHRFPVICEDIKTILSELRSSAIECAQGQIEEQFEMETLVYSQDLTYLAEIDRIEKRRAKDRQNFGVSQKLEDVEAQHVLDGIKAYFDVASRRVMDMVPMIIRHQLLVLLVASINTRLLLYGAKTENAEKMFEDAHAADTRRKLNDRKLRLLKAEMDLNRF